MVDSESDSFQIVPHHCGVSVPDIEASINWYRYPRSAGTTPYGRARRSHAMSSKKSEREHN